MNTHKRSGKPTSFNTDFKKWLQINDYKTYQNNGSKKRNRFLH